MTRSVTRCTCMDWYDGEGHSVMCPQYGRPPGVNPTPSVCDPNTLTGCCRWDHDHDEETK